MVRIAPTCRPSLAKLLSVTEYWFVYVTVPQRLMYIVGTSFR